MNKILYIVFSILALLFFPSCDDGNKFDGVAVPSLAFDTFVTLSQNSATISSDGTLQLTATILPEYASDKSVTWSSSDETVAKVDDNGLVSAVSSGSVIIKATYNSDNSKFATCSVKVEKISVSLNEASAVLYSLGSTLQLVASVLPEDSTDKSVTWISSDETVAKVNANGLVTAVGYGSVSITAISIFDNSKLATCLVKVEEISVSLNEASAVLYSLGSTLQLNATVLPNDATDKSVIWGSSDETVAKVSANGLVTAVGYGSVTIKATSNSDKSKSATCSVVISNNGHDFVDLGLPSGIKWATMNIGATTPEGYGDYFAWGETTGYGQDTSDGHLFNWENYKWCNGSYSTLTKYCTSSSYGTVDNKTTLELEDDAARANWGGDWRMPTQEELEELWYNCSKIWTTQNGVYGVKYTSRINGNSIFLPAAGSRSDNFINSLGSYGIYWSSSTDSWAAYYKSFHPSAFYSGTSNRCYGFSVRAVCQ